MTAPEARELLASCKRQRDVWRIGGMPPSPEAVAQVEREEAAAREVLAAEASPGVVTPSGRSASRAVAEARDVLHVATPGSVAHRMAEYVVAQHNARVAAEAEADGLRRDLAAVVAERDLYRAALADAARGEAPCCDSCHGCILATRAHPDGGYACESSVCYAGDECSDTPHAAAIRGALKATEGER